MPLDHYQRSFMHVRVQRCGKRPYVGEMKLALTKGAFWGAFRLRVEENTVDLWNIKIRMKHDFQGRDVTISESFRCSGSSWRYHCFCFHVMDCPQLLCSRFLRCLIGQNNGRNNTGNVSEDCAWHFDLWRILWLWEDSAEPWRPDTQTLRV
jgi:hypothetical protein